MSEIDTTWDGRLIAGGCVLLLGGGALMVFVLGIYILLQMSMMQLAGLGLAIGTFLALSYVIGTLLDYTL